MNLRKDHCRCLSGNTTVEHVTERCRGGARRLLGPTGLLPLALPGASVAGRNTARDDAKEHGKAEAPAGRSRSPPVAEANRKKIRLSATDISALASMKNVAKCDTWCELQNPVNHRVFERKLRPRDPPEGTPASRALEAHPRSAARLAAEMRTLALRTARRGGPKCAAVVRGRERRVVGCCARRPEPRSDAGPCTTP